MPLPPINVGDIRRTNSMPNLASLEHLAPLNNPQQLEGSQKLGGPRHSAIPADPVINNVVVNGAGPDLQPGGGQAANFAANHHIDVGRDWDMNSAEGMLETAQKAVANIKKVVAGKEAFTAFARTLDTALTQAMQAHRANPQGNVQELSQSLSTVKVTMEELKKARAALTAAVKDGSGAQDPRKGLDEVLKTLRVFRYEMQREFDKRGNAIGHMGLYEGALREIQHAFTFGVGSKVVETFARVMQLEAQLDNAVATLRNSLQAVNPAAGPLEMPAEMKLANVVGDALELSHLTNNKIRDFQEADVTASTLRGIVGPLALKGGSRKVEFNVGVGALIGLGFSSAFTAGIRAGARFRVIGEIDAPGKGRPISVTFRIAGGLEAKGGIKAGDESFSPDAKAMGNVGGEISHFTTRSYATVDDLILDANRCKLATSRTVIGAILGGIKALGFSIGRLGKKFFHWLGSRSGEIKQDNAQYLQSLKERGVAGSLDKLLAKRSNAVIVAERKGWTGRGQIGASVGANFGGVVEASLSGDAAYERDFKVSSLSFASVVRVAKEAKDIAALNALMRPDPDDGVRRPVAHITAATPQALLEALESEFDEAIREAKDVETRSSGPFTFTDTAGFARVANKIRSLMLATELAAREGRIPREGADRLLARYSNPSVRFPPDIFREYFMEGSGVAKPAKVRVSTSAKLKLSFFKDWSKGLTGDIGNSIVKAVANGAVNTMRKEVGLDTTFQYNFSSEKPANPGADPRPWENTVKTKHELLVSGSAPARIIIDSITRSYVNKGERIENQSDSLAKDNAKGLAKDIGIDTAKAALSATLPGLILASVKETAIFAVKKWLSDPENVQKLVMFALEHAADAFNFLLDAVQFVVEHPDLTLQVAASIAGTSSLGDSDRFKKITWSFVDGQFETLTVSSETQNKIGINVDPVGVAVGVGFDISYSVTETIKDRDLTPRPTLTMLLGKGEEFLFGETGIGPTGSGQAFKSWLSRNAMGVEHMIDNLMADENKQKTLQLYLNAQAAAEGDIELQQRLQDAWIAVQALNAQSTLDAKVDAAHELLVTMVLAYRSSVALS